MSTPAMYPVVEQTELFSAMSERMVQNPSAMKALTSIMSDFINLNKPNGVTVLPNGQADFARLFQACLEVMVEQVEKSKEVRSYTTTELAAFFGVTKTTINNWIDNGQFIGVDRVERGKHVRISENAVWVSKGGERKTIKAVVDEYFADQQAIEAVDDEQLRATALNRIREYEATYGSYDDLLQKPRRSFTEEGALDMWTFYRNCLEGDRE